MPELPEVESVRRSLLPHLRGATVTAATLLREDICESHNARGGLIATSPARLLKGALITTILRRGKQLAIIAEDGRTLCIHLGMSGQVLAVSPESRELSLPHTHATWLVRRPNANPTLILFRDPRRFGGLWTFPSPEALHLSRWNTLGPDALDADAAHLHAAAASSNRPIKALLLDQSVLAGIGNIYADEALFLARLHPRSPSNHLSPELCHSLALAIRHTLTAAIQAGGSTLRDYRDANGQPGTAVATHHVYGRAGQPCTRCHFTLISDTVAQRTSVWCSQCQQHPNVPTQTSRKTPLRP